MIGKYRCYIFSFMLCQSDFQITNPSGQGSPIFLPQQKGPYSAFQINVLGNRKNIKGEDSATVISSRGPNKACSSYISYAIMNNCISHEWELETALIDPRGLIHNESGSTPISNHKGSFLTKSAQSLCPLTESLHGLQITCMLFYPLSPCVHAV